MQLSPDLKTILVAEDEELNQLYINEIFANSDIELIFADNGLEAIELCKVHPQIDVVLMDVKMPKMSGLEATRLIKEFRPTLPVIIQTAYTSDADKANAFNAGCTDFIEKPIVKDKLLQKLAAL